MKVPLKMLYVMNLTIPLVKWVFFTAAKVILKSNNTVLKLKNLNLPLNDSDVNLMQSH